MQVQLNDEEAHVAFGEALGKALTGRGRVYLEGDLGAGKTTLTRGILRAYGYQGAVKSPTYTLVEPYELGDQRLYHLDLYRLADPEELEFMGGRDVLADDALCLIEWPSRGDGWLPAPDVRIQLRVADPGRMALLTAESALGQHVLGQLNAQTNGHPQEGGVIQWK
ncbi:MULTISPECIES: tRNA (adenosine(37)-N6)-threonylcarbamoyltransferase complex ATPase subunit type 1 TsaE [Halomonas]|uniref:tRNA threonylcarbamoyladenosine biosynthesis protein TsaE n=1 Tax=Vreelandella aquamarina TaxID=77097 RepID=A0A857GP43_9GAMM|nr:MULTISPECIES: tRNA (adenosine(37)-N6)-threonylcarbamoyltransferase complex ATPase subunit type 1 TsaE [Halomonas]MDK9687466.1 tRNA (adenosine(37)-N6)-threonylcarbamoyltransferase complex ATPase subunit type 1 TsaE [Halomonas sp. LC1]QHD50314.1 tRNA (adenosine(37)-N6)-threonylcarbamoyltransferase complex ATPase subunit type 1 TsaE [Halomonas meridiana]